MSTIKLGTENLKCFLLAKDYKAEIKLTLELKDAEALSEGLIKTIEILKKEIEDEKIHPEKD